MGIIRIIMNIIMRDKPPIQGTRSRRKYRPIREDWMFIDNKYKERERFRRTNVKRDFFDY
jgi:hypothetical protein